jgi:hypothetical protein
VSRLQPAEAAREAYEQARGRPREDLGDGNVRLAGFVGRRPGRARTPADIDQSANKAAPYRSEPMDEIEREAASKGNALFA